PLHDHVQEKYEPGCKFPRRASMRMSRPRKCSHFRRQPGRPAPYRDPPVPIHGLTESQIIRVTSAIAYGGVVAAFQLPTPRVRARIGLEIHLRDPKSEIIWLTRSSVDLQGLADDVHLRWVNPEHTSNLVVRKVGHFDQESPNLQFRLAR